MRPVVVLLLLLASQAGADWPEPPAEPVLDDGQREALLAGDILVDNVLLDESGGAARVMALFHTDPRVVWQLLADCEANRQFVRGLLECEVLEIGEHHALTRQVVKSSWLSPRLEYRFESRREPLQWVQIRLVSGDLKQMQGHWRFDAFAGTQATLVSHVIHVQPNMPVPRWLVRRTLRRDITDMIACLRAKASASGTPRQEGADRRRCP